MSELHRVRGEFAQNDAFLELVTGLVAAIERFDAVIDAHVPAVGTGVVDDAPVIELLLGAIALRAKLGERLAVGAPAAEAVPVYPVPGDLLR